MDLSNKQHTIRQLRKGDKEAFEDIYWLHRAAIYGLAFRYLKDTQLAEDAVQDVFLKLWLYRSNLDDDKSLRGFLLSTLKNHVLNMMKGEKRRIARQFDYAANLPKEEETPEEIIFFNETELIVHEGLRRLPENKQLVFRLKRFDGYSNREIAIRMGISIHTVKSQFYRASRYLREFVDARIEQG